MPRAAASSAAFTTRSRLNRSTPGIEPMGLRVLTPSHRNTGQIRSPKDRLFSCTIARSAGLRFRRRKRWLGEATGVMVVSFGWGMAAGGKGLRLPVLPAMELPSPQGEI